MNNIVIVPSSIIMLTDLRTPPAPAIKHPRERDAVPLIPAIQRRQRPLVRAVKHGRQVLAQPVVAHEEAVQARAGVVVLAVPVLADTDAAAGLGVAGEGARGEAAVVWAALVEEAVVEAGAIGVVLAGRQRNEVVV